MNSREVDLKSISHQFALWEVKISNHSTLKLQDINIIAEHTIKEILNIVFDYQLQNVNAMHQNHPSIDLGDTLNKVAFQVTSTKTTKKIQDTIDKFLENKLFDAYDQLFILILGKKQQRYPAFKGLEFIFSAEQHIIDFQDLLKQINFLPSARLRKLATLIEREMQMPRTRKTNTAALFKKNLAIKKKLRNEFVHRDLRNVYDRLPYEPYRKFIYDRLIVRSVADRMYLELDLENPAWMRMEVWDFYEQGLEFLSLGSRELIFDAEYNWDYLQDNDPRKANPNYKHSQFHGFLKIAYDDIVAFDPETDGYYGYPSLYCKFSHNNQPFAEWTYGTLGSYEKKKSPFRFDNAKQKKLP